MEKWIVQLQAHQPINKPYRKSIQTPFHLEHEQND